MADEVETDASENEADTASDEVAKWKALARKHEQQAKKNHEELERIADKARRFDELEEKDKSEAQRLADKLAAAEQRAAAAEANALRMEVASERGLTPAQAKRLAGATREEMEADADDLLAAFGPKDDESAPDPAGRPKPRLKGGTDPESEPAPDMREVVESIDRGF
jgi:hypothetical protein